MLMYFGQRIGIQGKRLCQSYGNSGWQGFVVGTRDACGYKLNAKRTFPGVGIIDALRVEGNIGGNAKVNITGEDNKVFDLKAVNQIGDLGLFCRITVPYRYCQQVQGC